MNIQWYPGHMVKAKKEIKESLNLVDVVLEILDARIPYSSQNPDINEIVGGKPRIVVLNKADLALEQLTDKWIKFYKDKDINAISVESTTGKGIKKLQVVIKEIMKEKINQSIQKGRIGRPIRIAVLGVPNVGKSFFINKVANRSATVTANKPGVTRKKQWVKVGNGIELMDTPGVLWPKFDSSEVGLNLAFTGAIREEIMDIQELAVKFAQKLKKKYIVNINQRYKLSNLEEMTGYEMIEAIGRKRGCIVSGGEVDLERASGLFLDEFRSGKLGRITLEEPKRI